MNMHTEELETGFHWTFMSKADSSELLISGWVQSTLALCAKSVRCCEITKDIDLVYIKTLHLWIICSSTCTRFNLTSVVCIVQVLTSTLAF